MSNTPRTDALHNAFNDRPGYGLQDIIEAFDFARELECENATFRAAQKACDDCDAPTMAEVAALRKQVELLTAERDGARAERNHAQAEAARGVAAAPHPLRTKR
jgi:hypothetical protein